MTKNEFIDAVAKTCGMNKKTTRKFLAGMMETVGETLKDGENIRLSGFGVFSVHERVGHPSFNPLIQKTIHNGPTKIIKFKPGKVLIDIVTKPEKIVKGRNANFV
jgi:DNA-binding protein HU-beta